MESIVSIEDEEKGSRNNMEDPLLVKSIPQGGLATLPFILANEGLERAASTGLEPNMIMYLMGGYGLDMATASNLIFFWNAANNFTPIFCAILADTFVGRFPMIGFGSIISLMGMSLLWSTTVIPGAMPPCYSNTTKECTSKTRFQLTILCSSLGLMSIGAGGIRSSTLAFGADQLVTAVGQEGSTPCKAGALEGFFNWYYFSISFAILFAFTIEVYIQDHIGWKAGFGVPLCLMLISVISFFSASSFYVKAEPKSSFFTGFAQVLLSSWRNRHYNVERDSVYHVSKGSTYEKPSEKLRFLNKACTMKEVTPEGEIVNPWKLCTIDQVEELKSVLKIIPLWSTGIILGVNNNQTSFQVLQANSMDRHIFSSSFEIPSGSFGTFSLLTIILWLVLYDRVIVPLASNKSKDKSTFLATKTRMGVGLVVSIVALGFGAVVESIRRDRATSGSRMSALWLIPQVSLQGLAIALSAVAQIEMFYSEFPKTMSSISSNLWGLGLGIASLFSSLIMSLVDHLTNQGGEPSWVSGDVNKAHYDYYYCLLAALSLLNYLYFLLCSRAYCQEEKLTHPTQDIT